MSKENTYFGTKYSEIVSNGTIVKEPSKIPISEVKFWKQHQSMSDLTPEVYGCESADNSRDSWATQYTLSLSNVRADGKYASVEHLDNGDTMLTDDMLDRFSLVPEREYEYKKGSIGCRGGGGKIEDFKEGFRKGFRQVKQGEQNIVQITLYRPFSFDGDELIIEELNKKRFKLDVEYVIQEIYEIPAKILNCKNRQMKSKEVYLYNDAFNLDVNVLSEFLSKRFSQVDKFNLNVEDVESKESIDKKRVFFRQVDNNNNAISDLTDIPKYKNKLFKVGNKHFYLRYHFRLSKKWDIDKFYKWQKSLKSSNAIENKELIKTKSYKTDQPLLQVYDNKNLWIHTGARANFWSDWKSSLHQNLEVIVHFEDKINEMTSLIKSRGFSDDDFEKALVEKVLKIIKSDEDTFKNPHYDKITDNEAPEVLKFIDNITSNFGLQMSFQSLNSNWTIDRLEKKKNWRGSTNIGSPAREIDLRFIPKDIPKVWFEFQSKPADYTHLDGIVSRVLSLNANKNDFDSIVWVAKSFDGKHEFLETVLNNVNWGDSNLSKIYLITKEQLGLVPNKQFGFQLKNVITIDVDELKK